MKKIHYIRTHGHDGRQCQRCQEEGAAKDQNKPVFTTIKENPITSIKDQNRSGTCWDYSTLSFFEAEILKATGKTYDLCESFVANKTYMERAIQVVRYHGDCQFAQGGSAEDVLATLKTHGICPEDAMPFPGSLYGDSLNNFNEFFSVLEPYVAAIAKSDAKKISQPVEGRSAGHPRRLPRQVPREVHLRGQGVHPEDVRQEPRHRPQRLRQHHQLHPPPLLHGLCRRGAGQLALPPVVQPADGRDDAGHRQRHQQGYTIAWGGDVSEPGFTRKGLAYAVDTKKTESLAGSDMARWLKLTTEKKRNIIDSLGCKVPEVVATQEMRQERFDNWELTDDHGMLIYGMAKDQNGKEYYMVKNSWGETGDYKGIWYMTKTFIAANTMDFLINKNAIPADIRKKLGI